MGEGQKKSLHFENVGVEEGVAFPTAPACRVSRVRKVADPKKKLSVRSSQSKKAAQAEMRVRSM